MEIKLELNMKCQVCSAINFAVPYTEKETRTCFRCGGTLKELTVDLKEDGENAETPEERGKNEENAEESKAQTESK